MELTLSNSRDEDSPRQYIPGKNKGIGIINVKRRLELLYPGAHEFRINSAKDRFAVYLKLILHAVSEPSRTELKNLNPLYQ